MTTSVIIKASCPEDRQVIVSMRTPSTGNVFSLFDGEEAERYIHGDMEITVRETDKPKVKIPDFWNHTPDHNG